MHLPRDVIGESLQKKHLIKSVRYDKKGDLQSGPIVC